MNCPKCRTHPLERLSIHFRDRSAPGPKETVGSFEVERCPSCGGVWFDKDEVDRYVDSGAAVPFPAGVPAKPADPSRDSKPADCPKCAVALAKVPAPSNPRITVDRCSRCAGIWLDAWELERASGKDLPLNERLKSMFGDLGRPGK
ncbi:MAG: zf-TFIIB domain-containing protein [Elusimicrobia bacterium]|nr:zf-TFIIB domain-containing protein [Elusimicrobiota bacterium]